MVPTLSLTNWIEFSSIFPTFRVIWNEAELEIFFFLFSLSLGCDYLFMLLEGFVLIMMAIGMHVGICVAFLGDWIHELISVKNFWGGKFNFVFFFLKNSESVHPNFLLIQQIDVKFPRFHSANVDAGFMCTKKPIFTQPKFCGFLAKF